MKTVNKLPLHLPYPEAIIFDWDNTLVDSHEIIQAALNRLFTAYDMPQITLEETKNAPQRAIKDAFPEMFGVRWEEARDVYHGHFKEIHLEMLKPKKGAQFLLEYLKTLNLPLFIVSNKTHEHLEAEIEALGWKNHFHHIRGSVDGQIDKPDPLAVHSALENSFIHPEKEIVWFIGDSPIDAECAVKSGCIPIIVQDVENILNFKYYKSDIIFIKSLLLVKELLATCK